MNTLIVDNKDDISDIIVTEDMYIKIILEDIGTLINIDVMENQNLLVFEVDKKTNNNINYNIRSGANVIVNKVCIDSNDITTIKISGENTSIQYNNSFISYNDSEYIFNIESLNEIGTCNLINRFVNVNNKKTNYKLNSNNLNIFKDNKEIDFNEIINLDNSIIKEFMLSNMTLSEEEIDDIRQMINNVQ